MILSKQAIVRSRAAWGFARSVLVDELADKGLLTPAILGAIKQTFAYLDREFGAMESEPTTPAIQGVRQAAEALEAETIDAIRRGGDAT